MAVFVRGKPRRGGRDDIPTCPSRHARAHGEHGRPHCRQRTHGSGRDGWLRGIGRSGPRATAQDLSRVSRNMRESQPGCRDRKPSLACTSYRNRRKHRGECDCDAGTARSRGRPEENGAASSPYFQNTGILVETRVLDHRSTHGLHLWRLCMGFLRLTTSSSQNRGVDQLAMAERRGGIRCRRRRELQGGFCQPFSTLLV